MGRFLKAKRELNPGDYVLSSDSYSVILSQSKRDDYCQFCLDKRKPIIKCDICKETVYCDEQCRTDNSIFHKVLN